jgi:hypothetical protein
MHWPPARSLKLEATGKVRRNVPDAIRVMVIGRLAVDREHQGSGRRS